MPEFIRDLASLTEEDRAAAGGKATALGRLLKAGFPVPPGFVVTTAALGQYLQHQAVAPPDAGPPGGAPETGPHSAAFPPERLREVLRAGPWPPGLAGEIESAAAALSGAGLEPLAVRSSATVEDLSGHSCAGLYETVLQVRGEASVLEAVRRVWTSLWSERALAYRRDFALNLPGIAMAVVVQRQVAAGVAGVLFTADPVSGDRSRLIVNAVPGLAEDLVSGRANPAEFVVDRQGRTVLNAEAGLAPPLGSPRLAELAELAERIERLFGTPQDIEWAFEGDRLWILQARPITTVAGSAAGSADRGDGLPFSVDWGHPVNRQLTGQEVVFWCNWNLRENMPYPLKPMSWSVLNEMFFPAIAEALWGIGPRSPLFPYNFGVDLIDGRAYFNMNRLRGHPFYGRIIWTVLHHLDREAADIFRELEESGQFRTRSPRLGLYRILVSHLAAFRTFLGFPWLASPRRIQERFDDYGRLAVEFGRLDLAGRTSLELLAEARRFTRLTALRVFPLLIVAGKALAGLALIRRLARGLAGFQEDDLLAGIPGNKTTESALEMYRLSRMPESLQALFRDGPLGRLESELAKTDAGRAFLGRLEDFLAEFGHRGLKDLDIGYPNWREDRRYIFEMIRGFLTIEANDRTPLEQFEQARRRRLAATAAVEAHLSRKLPDRLLPVRRWLFRKALRQVLASFPLRENEKHYGLMCYPGCRRILLEIGRRFREAGRLQAEDDVFFLTLAEVESVESAPLPQFATFHELVRRRKRLWREQVNRRLPFVVRSDGRPVGSGKIRPAADVLSGTPASPGQVEGVARIIREPAEAGRFGKGEILVAPYAEPGWAPLFLLAAGVVMEVGGRLCHGAIVAREYGIPAVVGVREATLRIRDGDVISVDGNLGEVRLPPWRRTPGQ